MRAAEGAQVVFRCVVMMVMMVMMLVMLVVVMMVMLDEFSLSIEF